MDEFLKEVGNDSPKVTLSQFHLTLAQCYEKEVPGISCLRGIHNCILEI